MAPLVVLVAIVATYILQMSVTVDLHLVDMADAHALAFETGRCRLGGMTTGVNEAVLAQRFCLRLLFLAGGLEGHHHTASGNQVFVFGQT